MEVGQQIFLKTQNNRARYTGSQITETTVTKVGRKYFWVEELPRTKFYKESMEEVTDYCVDYKAYIDKVAIEDELEKTALEQKIRTSIGNFGRTEITLEQLRKIDAVLRGG